MHGEDSRNKYPDNHVLAAHLRTLSLSLARVYTAYIPRGYTVQIMVTIKVNTCRFCGNAVLPKLSVALFTMDGLEKDLPKRISLVIDLPVSKDDGLPPHLCRPCMRRFQTAETFRSNARSSYEKQGYNKAAPPLRSPRVDGSRKRTKDTSGFEASPHTAQARPLAKCSTLLVAGKRLAFPPRENSEMSRYNKSIIIKRMNMYT